MCPGTVNMSRCKSGAASTRLFYKQLVFLLLREFNSRWERPTRGSEDLLRVRERKRHIRSLHPASYLPFLIVPVPPAGSSHRAGTCSNVATCKLAQRVNATRPIKPPGPFFVF